MNRNWRLSHFLVACAGVLALSGLVARGRVRSASTAECAG
jgi:hypothetical protein